MLHPAGLVKGAASQEDSMKSTDAAFLPQDPRLAIWRPALNFLKITAKFQAGIPEKTQWWGVDMRAEK